MFEFQISDIWDILKIICCLSGIQIYLGVLYSPLPPPKTSGNLTYQGHMREKGYFSFLPGLGEH